MRGGSWEVGVQKVCYSSLPFEAAFALVSGMFLTPFFINSTDLSQLKEQFSGQERD